MTRTLDTLIIKAQCEGNRRPLQFNIGEGLRDLFYAELNDLYVLNFRKLEQQNDNRDHYKGVPIEYFSGWYGIELITEPRK